MQVLATTSTIRSPMMMTRWLFALTFVQSAEMPVEDAWLLEQNLVARVGWSPEPVWLHGEEEGCLSVSA
eukprot:COSAG01_NODE_7896_length_3001_cov_13.892833_4_plen_69_part_00